MSKLDTLQAIRCIGLTGVVIGHMTFAEEKYSGTTLLPLATKDFNQLFIDWFFVVSGFIMVMVSRGRFQAPREILKFVYARLARIYPPAGGTSRIDTVRFPLRDDAYESPGFGAAVDWIEIRLDGAAISNLRVL